jgi:hypothetical protein
MLPKKGTLKTSFYEGTEKRERTFFHPVASRPVVSANRGMQISNF